MEKMDIGCREGDARGEAKGRMQVPGAVRSYLATAYPPLADDPAIDRIPTLTQALEALESLYRARSDAEVRAILGIPAS